jgi:hypothetical protein
MVIVWLKTRGVLGYSASRIFIMFDTKKASRKSEKANRWASCKMNCPSPKKCDPKRTKPVILEL